MDDRHSRAEFVRPDPSADLKATDIRKVYVENDEVWLLRDHFQRLFAGGRFFNLKTSVPQDARRRVSLGFRIVDIKDRTHVELSASAPRYRLPRRSKGGVLSLCIA